MAVVRDAELLYMVMRSDHGSRSQKYRTRQREPTENRLMSTFWFALFFPSHDPILDVSGTAFGGFGLSSEPDQEVSLTICGYTSLHNVNSVACCCAMPPAKITPLALGGIISAVVSLIRSSPQTHKHRRLLAILSNRVLHLV